MRGLFLTLYRVSLVEQAFAKRLKYKQMRLLRMQRREPVEN